MSKTTKTTTAKPAPIQCNNTACKFCGLTGFCFAHPGDKCPDGKINAPAPEPVKAQEPKPVKEPAADPTPAHKVRKPRAVKPETVKAQEPAPVKKSTYTDHLADWKDDTARNLHSEVRVKIAAWCATNATAEVEEFALLMSDYLYILEESTNGISKDLQDFRLELDDELFERIKRVFGEKAATEIHGCL